MPFVHWKSRRTHATAFFFCVRRTPVAYLMAIDICWPPSLCLEYTAQSVTLTENIGIFPGRRDKVRTRRSGNARNDQGAEIKELLPMLLSTP